MPTQKIFLYRNQGKRLRLNSLWISVAQESLIHLGQRLEPGVSLRVWAPEAVTGIFKKTSFSLGYGIGIGANFYQHLIEAVWPQRETDYESAAVGRFEAWLLWLMSKVNIKRVELGFSMSKIGIIFFIIQCHQLILKMVKWNLVEERDSLNACPILHWNVRKNVCWSRN